MNLSSMRWRGGIRATIRTPAPITQVMKKLLLIIIFVLTPIRINAAVYGGSNLGYGGYPSHSCIKPVTPFKPYSFNNKWEIDLYNSQVDLYNMQFRQYLNCIKEYLENANNDIKRIQEKSQDAIDEADN